MDWRTLLGSVANIAQGAMKGQLPLSGWELSSQGVEQFGRSAALFSGLHHQLSFLSSTLSILSGLESLIVQAIDC